MKDKITKFTEYLESEREACLSEADELAEDDRHDEAVMAKIRANIFGIFAIVSQTAGKQIAESREAFIRRQIETIPEAWEKSLSAAESCGDDGKAMIERIKLDAMAEIGKYYSRLTGE